MPKLAAILGLAAALLRAQPPETVMVTLHAKPGADDELASVIARHWEAARELKP
jgi:hypothetical protein